MVAGSNQIQDGGVMRMVEINGEALQYGNEEQETLSLDRHYYRGGW